MVGGVEKWKIRNGFCIAAGLISLAPATFVLNRPGWYREKMLASGFPVLSIGSAFVLIAMVTQICEKINERMIPLNRIILMAIGALCILAASIVFTIAIITGSKRIEYAIVRITVAYCWLALFLNIVYIVLSIIWPQDDDIEELLSQQPHLPVEGNENVGYDGANILIDANATQAPVVKGYLCPPRSQKSVPSKRSMRGSIRSGKLVKRSERSGMRNVNDDGRSHRSEHRSHRCGRGSQRSGRSDRRSRRGSQRSAGRRSMPMARGP